MATQTTHYNLTKPALTDLVKVEDLNDNFDAIDEAIYQASQSGGTAAEMIAEEYDDTATYAVGDHCEYEGKLYRCTTAIQTAEDWTPGHWTEVTVAGELEGKVDKNGTDRLMTAAEGAKLADIEEGAQVNTLTGVKGDAESSYRTGNVNLTAANVGAVPSSEKGTANGVATLDSSGKVPSGQLPSYVDDVIDGYYYNGSFYSDQAHTSVISPEQGKIYVDITDPNNSEPYRWSGSAFVKISNPIDIDDTLTQQGKAADAKAAGDAINLRAKIEDVEAGTEAKKSYHLGFYYDEEGYLCQN